MNQNNISTMDVTSMVKLLSSSFVALIRNKVSFKTFPCVMLWGAPGVGKSQGVRQIAQTIERETDKKVNITDVRLMLFNPIDLRGIPTADKDKTLSVWLKPKIFQMDKSQDIVNILFLDEITAAPQSVQAAAYQITLDRAIGEHRLPDNCIVIAAGNRITDKSVAYSMPKALANRLCHIEITSNPQSWHDWAVANGIHEYIVGFLEYNSPMLNRFDTGTGVLAFSTPRSWEMVSNILNNVSDDINEVYKLIVGCIGDEAASVFKRWCEIYDILPKMEEILEGTCLFKPNETEILIALRSRLVSYLRKEPTQNALDKIAEYICLLSWNTRKMFFHDCSLFEHFKELLNNNNIYKDAVRKGLK